MCLLLNLLIDVFKIVDLGDVTTIICTSQYYGNDASIINIYIYIQYIHIYIYITYNNYSIGTRKAGDLGSTPSECQIFNLFRCVLSSVLPLRSVGRSNFDKGRHNLTTLIHKKNKKKRDLLANC